MLVIGLSLWIEWVAEWVGRRFGRGAGRLEGGRADIGLEWKDHDMLGEQAWRGRLTKAEAEVGAEAEEVVDGRDRPSMAMPIRSLSKTRSHRPTVTGKKKLERESSNVQVSNPHGAFHRRLFRKTSASGWALSGRMVFGSDLMVECGIRLKTAVLRYIGKNAGSA